MGGQSLLLGGWSGPHKDGCHDKWRPDLAVVAATINFAVETKRLENGISPANEEQAEGETDGEEESEEEGSG